MSTIRLAPHELAFLRHAEACQTGWLDVTGMRRGHSSEAATEWRRWCIQNDLPAVTLKYTGKRAQIIYRAYRPHFLPAWLYQPWRDCHGAPVRLLPSTRACDWLGRLAVWREDGPELAGWLVQQMAAARNDRAS